MRECQATHPLHPPLKGYPYLLFKVISYLNNRFDLLSEKKKKRYIK